MKPIDRSYPTLDSVPVSFSGRLVTHLPNRNRQRPQAVTPMASHFASVLARCARSVASRSPGSLFAASGSYSRFGSSCPYRPAGVSFTGGDTDRKVMPRCLGCQFVESPHRVSTPGLHVSGRCGDRDSEHLWHIPSRRRSMADRAADYATNAVGPRLVEALMWRMDAKVRLMQQGRGRHASASRE